VNPLSRFWSQFVLATVVVVSLCCTGAVFAQDDPAPTATDAAAEKPVADKPVESPTERPVDEDAPEEHETDSAGNSEVHSHAAGTASDADHGDHGHGDESDHDKAGHGDGGHGEGGHGHPKYSLMHDLNFWSMIAFIGFVGAIFKLGLWNLLTSTMSERENRENEQIANAEGALSSAQSDLSGYKGQLESIDDRIRETLEEAERDAKHTQDEILEAAASEAQLASDRATHEIERVRDQSLNDLFSNLASKVSAATEAIVREKLESQDQDRLIDDTLEQLSTTTS